MSEALKTISLKIKAPTGSTFPGRGFYQLEEDALYVPVGEPDPGRRFFSYLESKSVRFDIDRQGCLMLIEVDHPRRHWTVESSLRTPIYAAPADIRWLDFRSQIPNPELITNPERSLLLIRFDQSPTLQWHAIAENVLVQTNDRSELTAIMITAIEDDLAGRKIGAFRKLISRDREKLSDDDS